MNVSPEQLGWDPHQIGEFRQYQRQRVPESQPHVPSSESEFAPRGDYGQYLRRVLAEAGQITPLELVADTALDVIMVRHARRGSLHGQPSQGVGALSVVTSSGRRIWGAHLVLALGNPPAEPLARSGLAPATRVIESAYAHDRIANIDSLAHIGVIGAGLTAVDVVLSLRAQGHRGPVSVISSRGAFPPSHAPAGAELPLESLRARFVTALADGASPARLAQLTRAEIARIRRAGGDWQLVIDYVRPHINRLYQRYNDSQHLEALRILREDYEPYRHRIPAAVAQDLQQWEQHGWLRHYQGRVRGVTWRGHQVDIMYSDADHPGFRPDGVDVVINATGSTHETHRYGRLINTMLRRGILRSGPGGLGIAVDGDGRVLCPADTAGVTNSTDGRHATAADDPTDCTAAGVWALGPVTRGSRWETTAIPEIRAQAAALAAAIGPVRVAPKATLRAGG